MASFKNIAPGARGIRGKDGQLVMIEPGISAEVDASDIEMKDARESGFFEIDGKGGKSEEPGPLDQSVEDLTAHLATVEDAAEIDRLIEAETAGKSRKGALAALEERKAELAG